MHLFKINSGDIVNLDQIVSIKRAGRGLVEGEYILHFSDGRKMNLTGDEVIERFEKRLETYLGE